MLEDQFRVQANTVITSNPSDWVYQWLAESGEILEIHDFSEKSSYDYSDDLYAAFLADRVHVTGVMAFAANNSDDDRMVNFPDRNGDDQLTYGLEVLAP